MPHHLARFLAGRLVLSIVALSVAGLAFGPTRALAEANDALPGDVLPASPYVGHVSAAGDQRDVFHVTLAEGQTLFATFNYLEDSGTPAAISIREYAPGTASLDDWSSVVNSDTIRPWRSHVDENVTAQAGKGGDYYLCVTADSNSANYEIVWSVTTPSISVSANRLTATVMRGYPFYPGWPTDGLWIWTSFTNVIGTFTADTDQSWVSVTPTSGAAMPGYRYVFTPVVDASSLATGSYEATITIRALGAEPRTCALELTVVDDPPLLVSPEAIGTSVVKGTTPPDLRVDADCDLSGIGPPSVPFTAHTDQSWLSVSPSSGSAGGHWHQQFGLAVDTTGLSTGTHDATVSVQLGSGEPRTCSVRIRVLAPTSLSMSASAARVTYGGAVTFGSSLCDSGGVPIPGMQAVLQRSYDGANWTTVTAQTSASGAYSAAASVDRKTHFRWVFAGAGDFAACVSGETVVESYAYLGTPSTPKRMRPKHRYLVTGVLKPAHANGSSAVQVYFQYYYRGGWRAAMAARITVFAYKGYSRYGFYIRYYGKKIPRRWRIRAMHQDADHLQTYSSWRYYLVY